MAIIKKTVKKAVTKKTVAKSVSKKPAPKKTVVKKPAPKKPVVKKVAAKKPAPKKALVKKPTPKKAVVKKPAPKKIVAKKVISKKPVAKKTAPKKVMAKKAPAKLAVPKKAAVKAIQTTVSLIAATPAKTKKPAPVQHITLKTNLSELIPEYEAPEEEIKFDYMDEKHKAEFHTLLNNWKKQLMTEVDRTVEHMKDETGSFADPADRATQEEGFSLELRARDRERNLIKKIEEALRRLEDGDYGYCEACGVEIGYKRLEARPTATLCIDCKTVDEIRERQLAS
jgi:DnaK suppressor protein